MPKKDSKKKYKEKEFKDDKVKEKVRYKRSVKYKKNLLNEFAFSGC